MIVALVSLVAGFLIGAAITDHFAGQHYREKVQQARASAQVHFIRNQRIVGLVTPKMASIGRRMAAIAKGEA